MAVGAGRDHPGEDRLSDLDDDLLREIISRLPITDAARTTTLASRWRHLWHSTPLVLDDTDLPETTRAAAVDCILSGHPGPFHAVRLYNCSFGPQDQELGEWLRLLAAKGTRQLFLFNQDGQPSLRLPADFFRCSSLQSLALCSWTFPDEHLPGIFPNLRKLAMSRVSMTDLHFDHLLAASPVLEAAVVDLPLLERIYLRSQSVRCVLLGISVMTLEVAVVDVPQLQRLFLFWLHRAAGGLYHVRLRIACAPNLRVLGCLDPGVHKLQIGDNNIEPNTMASPSTVVPGVKILALKVNFGIFRQVNMLVSFLRCFPHVDTLHIESVLYDPSVAAAEPTTEHHANFWQKISPVECLRSCVKKMVFHRFQGDQNKFEFLKFMARDAGELQSLLVLPHEADKVNEMIDKIGCPRFRAWAFRVLLVLLGAEKDWRYPKASDLTVDDPFL
ncbi:putative F-box/LRR-repeat protein At3g28410 [Brachypodium distachyon]|uniref:Uncharacterized protein n=1 Tax=Brachypodium distachyon TaxID=15368 RepID=A0A0Q3MAR7_BRADI|nr:putative F-box/LRR-repeat protein At3g28410 [Brachypodium distachyon]KQK01422.1 hypothetical protein BRADI_3g55751v3 [Brachypodium distachyon]PNT69454.1 hypothetical protein BRADI_3g55751v3 [Brachypodium distachyon]|eukprot:XP_003572963.1 putative F-box/LRR-repeat protein At3g28410 [Brachypodium distachyon]